MNGILIIDKPKDYTSRDVVNVVSKSLHIKKVGHTGTLDPLATGVLVLCVGSYTKFVSFLTNHEKEYYATIQFGIETDTLDITGKVLYQNDQVPTKEDFQKVLLTFLGRQKQEVPIYSAKKVNGKRLYDYAREDKTVEAPVQEIFVKELELVSFQDKQAVIRCVVSKGTYIRSLIRDICSSLNVLGTMSDLRRTKLGSFDIAQAISLENVKNGNFHFHDFSSFLEYETYDCSEEEKKFVDHANELYLSNQSMFVLITYLNQPMALYQRFKNRYKPIIRLTD